MRRFAPDLEEMTPDAYPDVCVTAPVAVALVLGHDDEAPTLRLDRSALFQELRRRDAEEAARKAKHERMVEDFRDGKTLDVQCDVFDEDDAAMQHPAPELLMQALRPPTLPAPPPLPAPAAQQHLEDAAPLRLVRRKDQWMERLPAGARAVLDEAASLQPSWPLRRRVAGAVAIPKQRIPSLRPRHAG